MAVVLGTMCSAGSLRPELLERLAGGAAGDLGEAHQGRDRRQRPAVRIPVRPRRRHRPVPRPHAPGDRESDSVWRRSTAPARRRAVRPLVRGVQGVQLVRRGRTAGCTPGRTRPRRLYDPVERWRPLDGRWTRRRSSRTSRRPVRWTPRTTGRPVVRLRGSWLSASPDPPAGSRAPWCRSPAGARGGCHRRSQPAVRRPPCSSCRPWQRELRLSRVVAGPRW